MSLIWIQGAGEQASGVAWTLVRTGYTVVAAEIPAPRTVRRLVSFSEAVHGGTVTVEGVDGVLADDAAGAGPGFVTVVIDSEAKGIASSGAAAVVDARLTKRRADPLPHGDRPLIGLGPGFTAGADAALVIETHRPAGPGRVIHAGGAEPATGVPGEVGGETLRRVLRAPCAGRLEPLAELGDLVREGQVLARIGEAILTAPFDGRLRGLIHPDVELLAGMKVGDVDPRGRDVDPHRISDKALAIGKGVVDALERLGIRPGPRGLD